MHQIVWLRNPHVPGRQKHFCFDYSLWSHAGYKVEPDGYLSPVDSKFIDQRRLFERLGLPLVNYALEGYNCSLFTYGQTGSGKSFSILGFDGNPGLVPYICEELLHRTEPAVGMGFGLCLSMMEIYCEKVRDLLDLSEGQPCLKVREHPELGFFVEGLSVHKVTSLSELAQWIGEGAKQRTLRATNMNATSSRAHTIIKLCIMEKAKGAGARIKSEINLVDLAGSERQKVAKSAGERLKEGILINKSLTTLGRVIKILHEKSLKPENKAARTSQVPYRDSLLTSLMKNALGGNSITTVLATIAPAESFYEETLSTLRFANRCKGVKTIAVVNEELSEVEESERLVRELRQENSRLRSMLRSGSSRESLPISLESDSKMKSRSDIPYLWNLNEDPMLTNVLTHYLEVGETRIGSEAAGQKGRLQIRLQGLNIQPQHAVIRNESNRRITIAPVADAKILVNGKALPAGKTELNKNDRIYFGGTHLFVFVNPLKGAVSPTTRITYELAQREIAENATDAFVIEGWPSDGKRILEGEVLQTLTLIYKANAIAHEIGRDVTLEPVLIPPELTSTDSMEIGVRFNNNIEGTSFLWDRDKFLGRYSGMQELYENVVEGRPEQRSLSNDRDPFYESPNAYTILGRAAVYLQSLAHLMEMEVTTFPIMDVQCTEIGKLSVALTPCNPSNGQDILGEYEKDPNNLVSRALGIKVKLISASDLPERIANSWCEYRFFDGHKTETDVVPGTNPSYAHEKLFLYRSITKELVEYLRDGLLTVKWLCSTLLAAKWHLPMGDDASCFGSCTRLYSPIRQHKEAAEVMTQLLRTYDEGNTDVKETDDVAEVITPHLRTGDESFKLVFGTTAIAVRYWDTDRSCLALFIVIDDLVTALREPEKIFNEGSEQAKLELIWADKERTIAKNYQKYAEAHPLVVYFTGPMQVRDPFRNWVEGEKKRVVGRQFNPTEIFAQLDLVYKNNAIRPIDAWPVGCGNVRMWGFRGLKGGRSAAYDKLCTQFPTGVQKTFAEVEAEIKAAMVQINHDTKETKRGRVIEGALDVVSQHYYGHRFYQDNITPVDYGSPRP